MKGLTVSAVVVSGMAVALACGSASGTGGGGNYGGAGATGPGGSTPGGGPGGSGVGALGGIAGGNGSSGSSNDPDAACESISQDVQVEKSPVDIVWGVDTSGSMFEESVAVQENVNAFSQQISAAGIDVHVVMMAGYPICAPPIIPGLPPLCIPGICVSQPLGAGQPGCTGGDSKPPNFFHHPSAVVQSQDGAVVFMNQFQSYRQMFRTNSLKYLVIVTDDDSTGGNAGAYADNPDRFIADYTALDPMLRNASGGPAWKMSGLYAYSQCPNAAAVGNFWKAVIEKTGGVPGDICSCPAGQQAACTQTFKTVFDSLARTIVTAAKPLDCEYAIPPPPPGKTFDKERVNIELTSSGAKESIYWVSDASACDPTIGGWFFDNNDNPTRILTCPASCDKIKATTNGGVSVAFGCARRPIPR